MRTNMEIAIRSDFSRVVAVPPKLNHRQPALMGLDFLDLPTSVVERLAMVRLDEPIAGYETWGHLKTYVFWKLRELGHRGVSLAAFEARHSVLRPTLRNVAVLGDAGWCRVILKGGADVEAANQYGHRALHNAARFGHADVVAVLLEGGANVDAEDSSGWRALHRAADHGFADAVAVLLEHGADVEAVDGEGWCALHWAAVEGYVDVVAVLLEHGADQEASNSAGDTALDFAFRYMHPAVMALLSPSDA